MSPRAALHVEGGGIIAGTNSATHTNVLDLSSNGDRPTATIKLSSGGFVETTSDRLSTSLRLATPSGANSLFEASEEGLRVTLPERSDMTFFAGRETLAHFTENGLSLGLRGGKLRLDVRGHAGVSDGSSHPKSWVMMRAASAEAPPSVCYPEGSELKFGTMRSYDVGAIWRETASMSSDGTFRVAGRIAVGIARVALGEGCHDDLSVDGAGIVKVKSAVAGSAIGGIRGGTDGAKLTIVNASDVEVQLFEDSAGSERSNRLAGAASVSPGSSIGMVYDGEVSRWLVIKL